MLLGMILPTTGFARGAANPVTPGQPGTLGPVGKMVETPHAYPELSVYENWK